MVVGCFKWHMKSITSKRQLLKWVRHRATLTFVQVGLPSSVIVTRLLLWVRQTTINVYNFLFINPAM
jgi:hypothetical protein